MKLVLDVKIDRPLEENDIIVVKDGNFVVMSKASFLSQELQHQNEINLDLEEQIKKLQSDLVSLAIIVKEK